MGIGASLFCSGNADKETLYKRITPSAEQVESQREYWNDLADYLKADLKVRSGYAVSSWIQGSYKFATQIRPARKGMDYDIDLGVYFAWAGKPEDGRFSAANLKSVVQKSLQVYANDVETDATGVSDPKEFCSRVRFSDDFHVDVPAYHEWDDVRRLASASDGFVDRDPYTIWEWWIQTYDLAERPRARRMVRYLKMWAALKFDAKTENVPSSILLTVLVAYAYPSVDLANVSGDDELFAALIEQIRSYLGKSNSDEVPNPVDVSENLNRMGDDFAIFRDRLSELGDACDRALAAEDVVTAASIWSEPFEFYFPLPEDDDLKKSETADSRALVAAFVPEVEVTVTLETKKSYVLKNGAANVPKGSTLGFRLVNYGLAPAGALVRWTVRNAGAAAEAVNDLGHFSGFGQTSQHETAEYRGRHYMDISVHSAGRVIGMRRIPVSIISNSIVRAKAKRLFSKRR
ncbi:cyclic GMP-AMP synthase DncV-like nucleotidyltransferase [Sphingomonas sp. RB1R13]|uniref:cyclic GMP-AMP synthase DncV-like nucleotidyltransferase n=1 Tax=Sphingomonas sp. RB1R13 TaxID=3096159 RepID=UPI002FCA4D8A